MAAVVPTLADGNIRVATGHNRGISSSVTPDRGETGARELSRLDILHNLLTQLSILNMVSSTKIGMLIWKDLHQQVVLRIFLKQTAC